MYGAMISAQEKALKDGNREYGQFAYVNATEIYQKVAKNGYRSVELLEKLGNAYYFQAKLKEANKWYAELFASKEDLEPEYYFRYAQTLKSIGEYEKADQAMEHYYGKSQGGMGGLSVGFQKDYLSEINKNSGRYQIKNAGINSKYSDYGSSFYNNQLVFASSRDKGKIYNRVHDWTGQIFTNLYVSRISELDELEQPERLPGSINSKYHESTPVFTKDGKSMYFTRNNYLHGRKGKDGAQTVLLKLYRASKVAGKWQEIVELPFNSDDYSVAHPALSPDEKFLYFASDMPGTKGMSDIFKVRIFDDGTFGEPVNLGEVVNTEARETFPFVTAENELYFASDGHPGLGGLDIFMARRERDGTYGGVKNVGGPVNGGMDDFAFIIDTKSKKGYFTSNREEDNMGYDDIYMLTEIVPLPMDCEQTLSGEVRDLNTNEPIVGAQVLLYDDEGDRIHEAYTGSKGEYQLGMVNCGTRFHVRVVKETYKTDEVMVSVPNEFGKTYKEILLEPEKRKVSVGEDLRLALGIEVIYFDLDKSDIREDAAVELAKILEVLKEYPAMKIDVRSHTDCRQTAWYNMALSERRAKSTMKWLIAHGIAPDRLTGRGYGESQLVNDCGCEPTNESSCTEEQHQANRRSEFIISSL